jgi:hypothetical protein
MEGYGGDYCTYCRDDVVNWNEKDAFASLFINGTRKVSFLHPVSTCAVFSALLAILSVNRYHAVADGLPPVADCYFIGNSC